MGGKVRRTIKVLMYCIFHTYFDSSKPNKLAKSSKFLSPPQADGVLRNFAPSGTDFVQTWNPRSKLRGIQWRIKNKRWYISITN